MTFSERAISDQGNSSGFFLCMFCGSHWPDGWSIKKIDLLVPKLSKFEAARECIAPVSRGIREFAQDWCKILSSYFKLVVSLEPVGHFLYQPRIFVRPVKFTIAAEEEP